MASVSVLIKVERKSLVNTLPGAGAKLDGAGGEVVLYFSDVRQIDANEIKALQEFAGIATTKNTKLVLRGVNVGVYKVLKLVSLAPQFSCVA